MWRVVSFAAALLAASAAVASPKDDSAAAVARGVALRKAGDDAGALKEFQRARALQPSAVATAQIGLARQALGEWVEAEVELQEALRERDDPWIAKHRATLHGALAMVRMHLGAVEVVGLPAGAELLIDGRRVGVAPLAGPVRATIGTVALEARCAGYLPVVRNVSVAADELSRETVTLTREAISPKPSIPVAEKAADEPRPSVSESHTTAAWMLGGDGDGAAGHGGGCGDRSGQQGERAREASERPDLLSMGGRVRRLCR